MLFLALLTTTFLRLSAGTDEMVAGIFSGSIQHYKIINSCEITPKTGAEACVHSEIKYDIEQKSYSEVN